MADDLDVENQLLAECGAAFRSVGERLVLAAQVRRGLGSADRALFDAELAGILRRVVAAAPIAFAALESGLGGTTP